MVEKDNIAIEQGVRLNFGNRANKALAIAGSVLTLAGAAFVAKEATFDPDIAIAGVECTTTTTTSPDGTTTTTSEQCSYTDEGDSAESTTDESSAGSQQKPDKAKPKPDKPSHNNHNKDEDKKHKKETGEDAREKKANSQKGFPGFNMEDSAFTSGNGCFITGAASSLRRETGDPSIRPKKIYNSKLRSMWSPNQGVKRGLLFDALPSMAARFGVAVWKTGFKGALAAKKRGDEVMMLAGPGHFTSQGHYMAVRGVSKNGRRLIIDDPNGKGKYGDSERKSGWNGQQLKAGGVIDYRVLHLKGVK